MGHLRSDNSRSDFSPSSGNTSPGREPVPEAGRWEDLGRSWEMEKVRKAGSTGEVGRWRKEDES